MLYRLVKGRKYPAVLDRGRFVLGDPSLGHARHIAGNEVFASSEAEAVDLIKRGYYLRVEPLTGQRPTLVRLNLHQSGIRLT